MVEARSLRKAAVPNSLLSDPSPGCLQPTRLALHVKEDGSSSSVYIASGCHVYNLEISMEGSMVAKGKESLLIPIEAQVLEASILDRCPHRSEIQSVVIAESKDDNCLILGTVDSYGHLIVSQLDTSTSVGSKILLDIDRLSYSVLPRDIGVGEASWAGISFSPIHWPTVAVARSFCKSVDVYDQDIPIRSFRTLWFPNSLAFVGSSTQMNGSSPLLAVAEGSQLSIWDLRANKNGGCVQRISSSIGDMIYAVCVSSSGSIAIGGSDRNLTIVDPRRWTALSRWTNCSKYEITGLSFSSTDPSYIYIQGVDYEVTCGNWERNEKSFSFRGDSNWLGFSKCPSNDAVAGWSESGNIFIADVI
ncbi:hypothetical protein LUZ62_050674 [Rhynchospora pubera]|uniref:Uncharacterized protein n=1 Tax=Rhynchospora pubera TaxID=906938 RepID=A0AAV8G964_9POAL|nr:hypothetical protein LUZ62_050674 [Rhynchospora pubera]